MISPYIKSIKEWKIREMVSGFLRAKAIFERHNKRVDDEIMISFGLLKRLVDILFHIKEDHHLIFKRIIIPKKRIFEEANKFTPDESEINFMNSVGLLFHKMMVARELKYMLDYYTEDSTGYQETKNSVDRNLQRISLLFKQGIEVLIEMLKSQKNNIFLITYFIENQKLCTEQLHMDLESILKLLTGEIGLERAYLVSAKYYANSGWPDKSKEMCTKALALNPDNEEAQNLIQSI